MATVYIMQNVKKNYTNIVVVEQCVQYDFSRRLTLSFIYKRTSLVLRQSAVCDN